MIYYNIILYISIVYTPTPLNYNDSNITKQIQICIYIH